MNKKELAKAVDDLSSPSRRKRQEAAHAIAESMLEKPQNILSFTDDIFDALERPEAQTRWELLNSLTMIVEGNTRALAPAVHFAEPSLFDEDSSTVRLASFRFITAVGAQTKALSKKVWPMLEESIQVYHGDPQYREMLMAITEFVAAPIDPDIKKAVVARIKFDANNSTMPIIKHLANDVLKAARGQKVQQKGQQKTNAPTKQSSAAGKKSTAKVSSPSKKSTTNKKASASQATHGAKKTSSSKTANGGKKASSKSSQAKKAAAKKPAAKKVAMKKTDTKKATKTAAKTVPTKKPAAKKTAAKKTAAKKTVKAAAAKKTATKTAAAKKTDKAAAAKKTATKTAAAKKTATNKVATKKATVNKKAASSNKSSSSRTASATKQSKTSKKKSGSKAAPQTKKTVAVNKQSATKKAKARIAGSKAAQALKKLTSKKSR